MKICYINPSLRDLLTSASLCAQELTFHQAVKLCSAAALLLQTWACSSHRSGGWKCRQEMRTASRPKGVWPWLCHGLCKTVICFSAFLRGVTDSVFGGRETKIVSFSRTSVPIQSFLNLSTFPWHGGKAFGIPPLPDHIETCDFQRTNVSW